MPRVTAVAEGAPPAGACEKEQEHAGAEPLIPESPPVLADRYYRDVQIR